MATSPILTRVRRALWFAMDSHAELNTYIKHRFKWEDSGAIQAPPDQFIPAIGECPGLSIFPVTGTTPWHANQNQKADYTLALRYWTPEWNILKVERIWQLVNRAFWQGPVAIWSSSTYGPLHRDSSIQSASMRSIVSNDEQPTDLMEVTIQANLKTAWNPTLDTDTLL